MITVETFLPDTLHPYFSMVPEKLYPPEVLPLQVNGDHIHADRSLIGMAVLQDGDPCGRVILYRCDIPGQNMRTLIVGNYECAVEGPAASILLKGISDHAAALGYERIIGPINGTTWDNYRFCVSAQKDPFLSEMVHLPEYPGQWEQHGFTVMANYVSAIDHVMRKPTPEEVELEKHFLDIGVRFRPIRKEHYAQELAKIYHFSMHAFQRNYLFSEIGLDHFLAKYRGAQAWIDPELVIIAEHRAKMVGLCFTFPDRIAGEEQRLVLKTLARDPDPQYKGLGNVLARQVTEKALQKNFQAVIHALMYTGNFSLTLSDQFEGEIFRRYALYQKLIEPGS